MKDMRKIGIVVGGLAILGLVGGVALTGGLSGLMTTGGSNVADQEPTTSEEQEPFFETYFEFNVDVERNGETVRATAVHHCSLTAREAPGPDWAPDLAGGWPTRPIENCDRYVPAVAEFSDGSMALFDFDYRAYELAQAFRIPYETRKKVAPADTEDERVWYEPPVFVPDAINFFRGPQGDLQFAQPSFGAPVKLRSYWAETENPASLDDVDVDAVLATRPPFTVTRLAAKELETSRQASWGISSEMIQRVAQLRTSKGWSTLNDTASNGEIN